MIGIHILKHILRRKQSLLCDRVCDCHLVHNIVTIFIITSSASTSCISVNIDVNQAKKEVPFSLCNQVYRDINMSTFLHSD